MSIEEENKAIIRRFFELMSQKELDAQFELLAPEYVGHYTDGDMTVEQSKQMGKSLFDTFPDFNATVDDLVGEGDKVAVRFTYRGTQKGEFMGIAPTGSKFNITNSGIFKISNGKIVEMWATMDYLRMLQQLGAIPSQ